MENLKNDEKTFKVIYDNLSKIDVSSKVEQKMGLSYLSWANAIKFVQDAGYEVIINEIKESDKFKMLGTIIETTITIGGFTKSMWLPVMDNKNNSISVDNIDSRDINDAIMRCLVKNIALFGLGLSLYTGEININEKNYTNNHTWGSKTNINNNNNTYSGLTGNELDGCIDFKKQSSNQSVSDDVICEILERNNSNYTLEQVKEYYNKQGWKYKGTPIKDNFIERAIKNKWIK